MATGAKTDQHEDKRKRPRGERAEDPGDRRLTTRQARYLADETGRTIDELIKQPLGKVAEELRWHIDPTLWNYQRVCGRVVQTDPVTGEKAGVPFATVYVEDTDCTFLGLFPVEHPLYWWLFPVNCDREVIATTTTDECGNFCVLIPRWDVDRILRFRRERVCYPEIVRPRIPDLIERFDPPFPDPVGPPRFELFEPLLGRSFDDAGDTPRFGEPIHQPFDRPLPSQPAPLEEGALERALERLPEQRRDIDLSRSIGPFLRCRDVIVSEWEYVFDVPDITFRVTQDVDGDGDEEVIYSEGWFDVRWNDTNIPDVELEASPIARATTACDLDPVPCSDVPALLQIGRMPAVAPYLDTDGYATRVNRPRTGGDPDAPSIGVAESPFTGELQISGCYDSVDDAAYFRVHDSFEGTETPITGVTWTVGATTAPFWIQMTADGDGWYSIADAQRQVDPHLVMSWPTAGRGSGRHDLRLELADGSKSSLTFSDPLPVQVDDRAPDATLASVRWRVQGAGTSWTDAPELVGVGCPVVERPVGGVVEVRVAWSVAADHFRNGRLRASGCSATSGMDHAAGAGSPAHVTPAGVVGRWHASAAETGLTRTDTYVIPTGSAQGAYALDLAAFGRAFEPSGAAGPSADWFIDRSDRRRHTALRFAVIDT